MTGQLYDFARARVEHDLQHGLSLMQPAAIGETDENTLAFIDEPASLPQAERLTRVEANLCLLGGEAKKTDIVLPAFRQAPLEVQIGNRHLGMTIIAAETNPVLNIRHTKLHRADWHELLDEPALLAFIPISEPGKQGWFVTRDNNPLERHMRKLLCAWASTLHRGAARLQLQ